MISTTAFQIPAGDFIAFRFKVLGDETLLVFAAGAQNVNNNTPDGLNSVIRDVGRSETRYDENTARDTGDPLVSIDGETDVECRVVNNASGSLDVNPHFQVSIV